MTRKLTANTQLLFSIRNVFDEQRDFSDSNDFGPRSGRLITLALRMQFGNARSGQRNVGAGVN